MADATRNPVRRRGFTLLEMLVTMTIIAVAASIVLPAFRDDSRLRVMAASSVLRSDIELAQVMTISYPDVPVVVRFNPDQATYWLAYASNPDTPIARTSTNEPYTVTLGQERASAAAGVTLALNNLPGNTLEFNAQGGLADFTTTPTIDLGNAVASIRLSLAPMTGSITEADIESPPAKGK